MKLIGRWKLLIGQAVAMLPVVATSMAHANQAALAGVDWTPQTTDEPPV